MKTTAKFGVVWAMLIICASAFAAPDGPANTASNATSKKPASSKPTLIFNRKLLSTSVQEDEPLVSITASTFTPIDPALKFTCPHGGCTLTADLHVQVGEGSDTFNEWALCATIDGVYMQPTGACPYVGEVPTDGSFEARSFEFIQSGVTAGSHSIQSVIFVTDGALLATYDITYRLYTP
jgi:hypothetical protein